MLSLLISSVAVSRSKDVPPFGPPIPKAVTFPKSAVFRDFLLAKVINGENAAHKSEKFRAMATRTRQEYLKDLAENFVSTTTIDNAVKFSFINLGAKKKEKVKPRKDAHLFSVGAVTWSVSTRDFSQSLDVDCLLGISNEFIVLIEEDSKNVVFNCSCRDVIGWTSGIMSIKIFYERGECVMLSAHDNCGEDIREIVQRLEVRLNNPVPLSNFVQSFGIIGPILGVKIQLEHFCLRKPNAACNLFCKYSLYSGVLLC